MEALINNVLKNGGLLERINIGSFETYLIKNSKGTPLAIFKPGVIHEEKEVKRELAAYSLDYQHFANVPKVIIMTLSHPLIGTRLGSCHTYCLGHQIEKSDISQIHAFSIRRIAILDIRLLNIDRHINNFLVENKRLIPIDHHLVLPSYFGVCHFEWSYWEESKTPFSEEEKNYIESLDPVEDRKTLLDEIGIDLPAANLCFFATNLLKEGARRGLTPYHFSFFFELKKDIEPIYYNFFKKLVNDAGYETQYKLDPLYYSIGIKKLIESFLNYLKSMN